MFMRLPLNITKTILEKACDFRPALRSVCRLWASVLHRFRSSLSVADLATRGHRDMLVWTNSIVPFSPDRIDDIMTFAARSGDVRIVQLCMLWGAENIGTAIAGAAFKGFAAVLRLLKTEWGVFFIDEAVCWADAGDHERIVRLCKEWEAVAPLAWREINYPVGPNEEVGCFGIVHVRKEWLAGPERAHARARARAVADADDMTGLEDIARLFV